MRGTTRMDFHTLEDFQHCFRGADFEVVPLSPAPFRGHSIAASLGGVVFSSGQFEGAIRSRGMIHTEGITFGTVLDDCSRIVQWGTRARMGEIYVMPHDIEQDGCASGNHTFATLSVKPDELERMGVIRALAVPDRIWTRRGQFCASPEVRASVARSIRALVDKLTQPDFEPENAELDSLGQTALTAFLAGIELAHGVEGDQTSANWIGLVRKVEDWIDGRNVASVNVFSICQGVNVSLRTLQRAFQSTLQMGPGQYLALRRLAEARAAFLNGRGPNTVTEIALSHGFSELGRFAGVYRRYPARDARPPRNTTKSYWVTRVGGIRTCSELSLGPSVASRHG